MEWLIANRDIITTKLSGSAGSSKQEPLPPEAFHAASRAFTESLLCTGPVVSIWEQDRCGSSWWTCEDKLGNQVRTECGVGDGGNKQGAEMQGDQQATVDGEAPQRWGHWRPDRMVRRRQPWEDRAGRMSKGAWEERGDGQSVWSITNKTWRGGNLGSILDCPGEPSVITRVLIRRSRRSQGRMWCGHGSRGWTSKPKDGATSQGMQTAPGSWKRVLLWSLRNEHSPADTWPLAQRGWFRTSDLPNCKRINLHCL